MDWFICKIRPWRLGPEWVLACLTIVHASLAWFKPDAVAPLTLAWITLVAWHPKVRAHYTPRVLVAVGGLILFIAAKDLLAPGPFTSTLSILDPYSPSPPGRQPDRPRVLVSLGHLAAILLAIPALRALFTNPRRARAVSLGLIVTLSSLAFALLTHPAETWTYGKNYQLGDVASRNPAGAAFALGALIAFGAGLSAYRNHKPSALAAFAASGLCAAATGALGSRGGILALGAGAVFFAYQENRNKLGRGTAFAGGLVMLLLLAVPGPLARIAAEGEGYRLELAKATLQAFAHAPIGGLGLGGFPAGFALFGGLVPAEGMRAIHPDCGWLLLLCEWGILGLIALSFAFMVILRPVSKPEKSSVHSAATAGLVALAIAAVGDISFHRVELLVLGLPLLAQQFPTDSASTQKLSRPFRPVFVSLLAIAGLASIYYGQLRIKETLDPTRLIAASTPLALPLDPAARHLAGNRALTKGELPRAAAEYTTAAALDPANSLAIEAYARAIGQFRPDLALPLWQRLFAGASERAPGLLAEEVKRAGSPDASYWLRALPERPALWILPADSDLRGAQSAYEKWRGLPSSKRKDSPWRAVLGASARWGTAREFAAWLEEAHLVRSPDATANGGDLLRKQNRDDLAWLWLMHQLPPPPSIPARPLDASLHAVVLASPTDYVSAMHLVEQTPEPRERLALLKRLTARPDMPASFRMLLARELYALGNFSVALEELQASAHSLARQQVTP